MFLLGKTLTLKTLQLAALMGGKFIMYTLFNQIARFLPTFRAQREDDGVAHQLMESADACAGTNPHDAQELREAALAYLSVVR